MQTESNCKAPSIAVVKVEKYVYDSDSQFLELGSNTTLSKRGGITTCKQAQSKPRGRETTQMERERLAIATTW